MDIGATEVVASMSFYPGQRVVCVDDVFPPRKNKAEIYPIRGAVYTVRDTICDHRGLAIFLVEITNKPAKYKQGVREMGFFAHRFRPLDERRLDIFRDHLNRVPSPEKERA